MSGDLMESCSGCGFVVEGGDAGCASVFNEMQARDFSDPVYFATHRLSVDIYALQHPDKYCVSAKSLAAHLTGLCRAVEQDANTAIGDGFLQRWLNGAAKMEKPVLPDDRGVMTCGDVWEASSAAQHREVLQAWARSTWEAYAPLHALARAWIEEARAA